MGLLEAVNDKGNNVRFTFFLQTNKSQELADPVWAQALKDGHELGNHTQTHPNTANASDMQAGEDFIKQKFGVMAILSRKDPGKHDGADFGGAHTPVTIRILSLSGVRQIKLYKLANRNGSPASPAENSLQAEKIVVHSSEIPASAYQQGLHINEATGGDREGMPPGTAFLYVFER